MDSWKRDYYELLNKPNVANINLDAALALKRKNLPRFLYRYRKVRASDPDDYTINSLESGETWLSSPEKLNDPFDCALTFSATAMAKHWHSSRLKEILDATGHREAFTDAEIAEIETSPDPIRLMTEMAFKKEGKPLPPDLSDFISSLPDRILGDVLENLVSKTKDSLRLCCFSENVKSTLMWSHYAEDHKGICLEYDLDTWKKHPLAIRLLHPVHYTDTRFDATQHLHPDYATNVYIPIIAACNKAIDWAYENEWRFVVNGSIATAKPVIEFPGLVRIILGAKAPDDVRQKLESIPRLKSVPITKANLSKTTFSVEI
jgi:hypothetical protein